MNILNIKFNKIKIVCNNIMNKNMIIYIIFFLIILYKNEVIINFSRDTIDLCIFISKQLIFYSQQTIDMCIFISYEFIYIIICIGLYYIYSRRKSIKDHYNKFKES